MKLSDANRSEIQHDLSDKAFKYVASYTQIDKLERDVAGLKLMIYSAIENEDKAKDIEELIDKYKQYIKKLIGYGRSAKEYEQCIPDMLNAVENLKK